MTVVAPSSMSVSSFVVHSLQFHFFVLRASCQILPECDRASNGAIGSHAGVGDRAAAVPIAHRFMPKTRYAAGTTSIDNNGAVIMPATIGEAMRRMIPDPVPLPHMIGTRPGMILRVAQDRAQSASVETNIDP